MSRKAIDLLGKVFGKLTVIARSERRSKKSEIYWFCECECTKITEVCGTDLRNNKIAACVECGRKIQSEKIKKHNLFRVENNIVIGIATNQNTEFYFNIKYLDEIKKYAWRINEKGYVCSQIKDTEIKLHRFIMELKSNKQLVSEEFIDHVDKNPLNNKDENLRECTNDQNVKNRKLNKNNKSGVSGVMIHSNSKGEIIYRSVISVNHKKMHLISTKDFDEAVKARLQAEKEYYKEFAPQQYLFEKYGINKNE
jgi:hypothetical protein